MSMWDQQEILKAHMVGDTNGATPTPSPTISQTPTLTGDMATDLAASAFVLSVAALALAMYVYMTREVPK